MLVQCGAPWRAVRPILRSSSERLHKARPVADALHVWKQLGGGSDLSNQRGQRHPRQPAVAGSPCADRHGGRSDELDPVDKSPKLNQLDPYAYLKDVLLVPATHKVSLIGELLPHRRQPGASAA